MESELVTKELAKFDIVEAGLATLETRYLALKVVGVDDKDGAAIVHKARIDVKGRRIAVVKDGEEMRKDAIAWQKKVIGRVNEIVSRCERMEAHLQAEEDVVENEKARKKAEAEAKEAARFQSRIDRVCAFGATYDRQNYTAYGMVFPEALVKVCTDEQFESFMLALKEKKDVEDARIALEEAERKAESERLAKVAADQEAERKRLDIIAKQQKEDQERLAKEQAAAAAKLKADQDALEAEKKRIADAEKARIKAIEDEKNRVEAEKKRAEEVEIAKKEAAAKAIKDAEEKAKREADAKAEKEEKARIAAERKAARAPDKVKILLLADSLDAIMTPDVKTEEVKAFALAIMMSLAKLIKEIRDKAEVL